MKKLDLAPALRDMASRFNLSAADVHACIDAVAPGAVSRRGVDYWLADPMGRQSRPCEIQWVVLFLLGLQERGSISAKQMRAMQQEVVGAAKALSRQSARPAAKLVRVNKKDNPMKLSPRAVEWVDKGLRSHEFRQSKRGKIKPVRVDAELARAESSLVGL